ncbi:MAG: AtpZ/AtpI family protein [Pseudomonadota bacterium]
MARKSTQIDTSAKQDLDKRLKEMNQRLGRNVQPEKDGSPEKPANTGYGNAFRLSSEFISAILVGAAIGYGIDWLLGTTPWAMIVFLLLGFVAGIMNVLRAAGEMDGTLSSEISKRQEGNRDES